MSVRTVVPFSELPFYMKVVVRRLAGGRAFAGRLAGMGVVVDSPLEVLQNVGHGPVLILVRDTRIALGRGEAAKILVDAAA